MAFTVFWGIVIALSVLSCGALLFLLFGAKSESPWRYGAPWRTELKALRAAHKALRRVPLRTVQLTHVPLKRLKTH